MAIQSLPVEGPGVETVIAQIDDLLQDALGLTGLPSGTTGENLVERLGIVLEVTGKASTVADDGFGNSDGLVPGGEIAMSNSLRHGRRVVRRRLTKAQRTQNWLDRVRGKSRPHQR